MPRGEAREFRAEQRRLGDESRYFQDIAATRGAAEFDRGARGADKYEYYADQSMDAAAPGRFRTGFEQALGQAGDTTGLARNMVTGMPLGYSPMEQNQMRMASTAPIASAFRSAGSDLQNRAVRTGNATALAPNLTRMAQERGMAISSAQGDLAGRFADARRDDSRFQIGAMGDISNQQQNISGAYGAGQARETNQIPLFQFPAEAGFRNFALGQDQQLNAMGQRYGVLSPLASRANQPGAGMQLLQGAIGGAAGALAPGGAFAKK
jgi:hypothetical protein